MQVPAHIFREYDIRGVVDEEVTPELVHALGRAFVTFVIRKLGKDVPILTVGRDVRPSSDPYRDAMVQGLRESGAKVLDIGVVPTPVLYYACHRLDTDGGVMITASHNPSEYNGFKLNWRRLPLSGEEIQAVMKLIEADDFAAGKGSVEESPVTGDYLEMVAGKVQLARPVDVVLVCGNATGALFGPDLLERIGARVDPLFCTVDGTFPNHHPDPTQPENIADLRARVAAEGAELGIALDGDADRVGAVDATGRILWGDQLMILLGKAILAEVPGARFVGEVKCSQAMYDELTRAGGRPEMWKVGHSLIKARLKATGALLGGEMSGHMFFVHRYLGFDDAIYAGARLLELLSRSPRPLAELAAELPVLVNTRELRVECPDDRKFDLVRRVSPEIAIITAGPYERYLQTEEEYTARAFGHPNQVAIDHLLARGGVSGRRAAPIEAWVGVRGRWKEKKSEFARRTIDRAIYSTGWDGHVVVTANARGWLEVATSKAPAAAPQANR